jgi:uncharacterized membrane protein
MPPRAGFSHTGGTIAVESVSGIPIALSAAVHTCTTFASERTAWSDGTTVFAVFLVAQILDGALTYCGIMLLGIEMEANPLLAASMHSIGAPQALIAAKLLACACGYVLYRTEFHRPLAITAGLYVGVAIVPWLHIVGTLLISA